MSDIYLLDDHALMRDGLRAVLELGAHRVVGESADPTTALAELPRLAPDVLLLDLNLGQRSGFELLEHLPGLRLTLHTIVITMSDQPQHVATALLLGASGYVLKGSPASAVLAAVNHVVLAGRYLGPGVDQLAARALGELALAARAGALDQLSARERQIIALVVRGRTSAAIGEQLLISPKTVDSYRSRLMGKLGMSDVPALVRLAIREGLISADEI